MRSLFSKSLTSFALLSFVVTSIHSVETPLIPRELLFGNPERVSPTISPDGSKLAYLAPNDNGVLNVWVRDLGKEGSDRIITSDKHRGIRSYLWQYDNENILYVQDKNGDENWHLYQKSLKGNSTRDLTPFDGVTLSQMEYRHEHPDELKLALNLKSRELFDIYRLDLKTGAVTLDTVNEHGMYAFVLDSNLQVRVGQSYGITGDTIIWTRENDGAPWRELMRWGIDETLGNPLAISNDDKFLYIMTSVGNDTARLVSVSLSTGKQEVLAEDPEYDMGDILRNPKTHALEAVSVTREKLNWQVLDKNIKNDFSLLSEIIKTPFNIISRDLADKTWVVSSISDQRPSTYYLYDRVNKKVQFLFTAQPKLDKYVLNQMLPISYQARDGMKIHGYLTLPSGLEPQNLPTVLVVHGGPWSRDSWGYSKIPQWLANRGYAVLQINFRGSTGYGKKYLNAGNKEWAGKMHDDLLDGKQWLIDQGYTNPQKVAIFGGSYGGYATLVALTYTPEEFCCGIDLVGPSNLVTLLQTIPPYWAPLKSQFDTRVGNLDTEQQLLIERSPLFKADKIKKPLMIAQGANDPRVKQSESDQIVQAMRKNNLPVEYLLVPDEGHGFARPENNLKFTAAAEVFLSKYLQGRVEEPSSKEDWSTFLK